MFTIDTSGLHPTTEACLESLQWLQDRAQFKNILEIGCGSGILSVVAAGAWDATVLAADISPNAVADAQKTIATYGLESTITAIRSDGFSAPQIREHAPYDLIICNLVAETLIKLAPDVKKHLAPGGYCLLSGALAWLAEDAKTAYKSLGFDFIKENTTHSWYTAILCHTAEI